MKSLLEAFLKLSLRKNNKIERLYMYKRKLSCVLLEQFRDVKTSERLVS